MKVTRRQFLKATAVVTAATGLGMQHGGLFLRAFREAPTPAAQSPTKLVRVFSPGSGCHHRCVLLVHVADGRIVKAEAAPFPDQPESTHCCVRGLASATLPYYPDRLKYPVKRVGERGEGKWERISWDEALDTISRRLIEIRDQYGPEAVLINTGGSSVAPTGAVNTGLTAARFMNLFGATNALGWTDDTGAQVADFFTHGIDWDRSDPRGLKHSNLIIVWGANPAESAMRDMKFINLARKAGATLVVIGPVFDATAAVADWWIPIRAATDAALGMAMAQVIIAEGLYQADYLRRHTVAPLLVRDDNGLLLREADVVSDGSPDNFVAWDEATGQAFVVAPAQKDVPETVALAGHFTAGGHACRTAFQRLIDEVNQNYTPEKTAELTTVPADSIRELARRYAQAMPGSIYTNWGVGRYYHGNISYRAQLVPAILCGYLGRLGGGVHVGGGSEAEQIVLNDAAIQQPTDATARGLEFGKVMQAINTGDPYPIKAFLCTYANPIHGTPNAHLWLEAMKHLDFVVNVNIRLDWSAEYADLVLPDATVFERLTLSAVQQHLVLSGPAIEPMYEARTETWLWSELGKRVGLGEYFQLGEEDYIRMQLDSGHPSAR
jgi:molybdopterin-containing oxidoreductase family molybdopterin binding subunit